MDLPPFAIFNAAVLILWCYAAVLGAAWFRAVGGSDRKMHVAHFVTLMGVLVPLSASMIAVIMISGFLQVPFLLIGLTLLIPAGLVVALQLELSRLIPPSNTLESLRLLGSLGLFAAITVSRGGL